MKVVDDVLLQIEMCIQNSDFISIENEKIELKDNSHNQSEWTEVFKTTNAFLNTNGGIIIIGVYEDRKNKKYVFKGFDANNEDKLKTVKDQYLDDHKAKKDVSQLIHFETKPFLEGNLLIAYVDALPDDEKYIYFNGSAYERLITGDHKISDNKILSQKEYKAELIDTRELRMVTNAAITDLDVNKLNDYIHLLNSEVKIENIKTSITEAQSFLKRNGMIREGLPTILGILVCGAEPGATLHWRSQVDAYVESAATINVDIAQNKKIINNTVIQLMEQSLAFVYRNIQIGISNERGGTRLFEYPERLIRECINNSLAHRDYAIDHYININIVPGKHIQIRNPGRFKQQLLLTDLNHEIPIRRIISGNPKANNPKLAKILSVYSKYEGKGWGMASVIGACLEDSIDMPYYVFHSQDELSLYIPKGKLVDETITTLFESYSGYISRKLEGQEITIEQQRILTYFYKSELLNKQDRYTILLTKDNNHLNAIQALQDAGLIIRHSISDEIYSVFVVDRNLFKKSFYKELEFHYGNNFVELAQDYKEVLFFIYERNTYSLDKYPSANEIGSKIWIKRGNANVLEGYEIYKRKVRNIVNKLEKGLFILRNNGKPEYIINPNYKSLKDLFD
ncbi:MAG TPA: RNA-binding domain-containing protein [Mucilaginibacter sp.]|nr:RNA-binding domain-containing protein [Mucilaginibacter sp.]